MKHVRRLRTPLGMSCGLLLVFFPFHGAGADWPQYRGANHDGISTELIRTNWSQVPPQQVWKVALDPGLSSLTISGGRVFTQVRRFVAGMDQEVCVALNAETGAELWATPLGIADYPDVGVYPATDDGPRTTPSVDGSRVYVLTSYLRMACLEAATGQIAWSRNLLTELNTSVIQWQNTASPLIVGDLIFLNCNDSDGRLLALRKLDGGTQWQNYTGDNQKMTHATPIHATIAGTPQVIFFNQLSLTSVVPTTGAFLWRRDFAPFGISRAASPVVGGNLVYCSASYGQGSLVVDSTQISAGMAAQVWRMPGANENHWATPVHHAGFLYGVYGTTLFSLRCIELATGMEMWREELGNGAGAVLLVSGYVLLLTEAGEFVLVKPDSSAYLELARFTALDGTVSGHAVKCWNVPAISNGRIYVRGATEAACFDVSVPKLKLQAGRTGGSGNVVLLVGNEDGSALDTNRAAHIDILATLDLGLGAAGWTNWPQPPILTNGQLRVEDPTSPSMPRRFFKAQERP